MVADDARGSHATRRRAPVRVLHVVGDLGVGGIEKWLVELASRVDRSRLTFDFVVHRSPSAYEQRVRGLGCDVHAPQDREGAASFVRRFAWVLRRFGPFDAVHSHVHHASGAVVAAAAAAGVAQRIVHSHSDTRAIDRSAGLQRRTYVRSMNALISRLATHRIAASSAAAEALFGRAAGVDLVFCGTDARASRDDSDRSPVRAQLGIAPDALVIGHVGRLVEPKNHEFLLQISRELIALGVPARLLCVGDGPLRASIRDRAAAMGLSSVVTLLGERPDVARCLRAMDVFVFPSLWEGLPMSVVEAQAAGLPCLVSDRVSAEVRVVPELVHQMALERGAERWARTAISLAGAGIDPVIAGERIRRSALSIERSLEALLELYGA